MNLNELDVKAGDLVTVLMDNKPTAIMRVDKITKSHIVVQGDNYKKDGSRKPKNGGWHYYKIRPATDEDKKIVRKNELINLFKFTQWDVLEVDQLERCWQALIPQKGEKLDV